MMQANMLTSRQKRGDFSYFKPTQENFHAFLVVYKNTEGMWRGFAYPYGETTEAPTKVKAIKTIKVLADAYYRTIKAYDFPTHLTNGHLEDVADRQVFNWVVGNKSFMEQLHSKAGKVDTSDCYVEAYKYKA